MDLGQFLRQLAKHADRTIWRFNSKEIRSSCNHDPITFLANCIARYSQFSSVQFLDAAELLGLDSRFAIRIANASDGNGESDIRATILEYIGAHIPA